MSSPQAVRDFLAIKLGTLEHEIFCVMFLDLCVPAVYVESLAGIAEIA
jgi:DNA repair protein RadC